MPTKNKIQSYVHCRNCLVDLPDGESPVSWSRLEVGVTENTVRVTCVRCDMFIYEFRLAEKNPLLALPCDACADGVRHHHDH